MNGRWHAGADVGGTFTDFVLFEEETGRVVHHKVPSSPEQPGLAILIGLRQILKAEEIQPAEVVSFVHGTTLAVNTIIERQGAPTGLLVTAGFRDILEIGRLALPNSTDFFGDRVPPLVPRNRVKEIGERMLPGGRVGRSLPPEEVAEAVAELVAEGVEAVAVCFLHAYRHPDHERRAATLIRERWPHLFVTVSSEVWPEQREFERSSVAVMNAYVGPRMHGYLNDLSAEVQALGVDAPILITRSSGGVMSADRAAQEPVHTVLSGPANGVLAGAYWASRSGFPRVITFDMGGTSSDVSVVDGTPSVINESKVGEFPLIIPSVDVVSIGAGGGSIAWCDGFGVLKVGPRSAGADPGPACYGRGGSLPTVTDAYVVLGVIHPEQFLGGRMRLDALAAERAIAELGRHLAMGPAETADAIVRVATAKMHAQLDLQMVRRGIDPVDFPLLSFGGAGPTHAFLLAEEAGIRRVVIPPSPGTFCAFGCLVSDFRWDLVRTHRAGLRDCRPAELERAYALMEEAGAALASEVRQDGDAVLATRTADMRYVGQATELNIALPARIDDLAPVRAAFEAQYERVYGVKDPAGEVEILNLRLAVISARTRPHLRFDRASIHRASRQARRLHFPDLGEDVTTVLRHNLCPGDVLRGPAIVEEETSTTFVTPTFTITVDEHLNLVGERAP